LFISRWDVAMAEEAPPTLRNRLGIAISKRTYQAYRTLLSSPRWQRVYNGGERALNPVGRHHDMLPANLFAQPRTWRSASSPNSRTTLRLSAATVPPTT
jgi:hypothetical protein